MPQVTERISPLFSTYRIRPRSKEGRIWAGHAHARGGRALHLPLRPSLSAVFPLDFLNLSEDKCETLWSFQLSHNKGDFHDYFGFGSSTTCFGDLVSQPERMGGLTVGRSDSRARRYPGKKLWEDERRRRRRSASLSDYLGSVGWDDRQGGRKEGRNATKEGISLSLLP